jgi:hypothetical protein
MSEPGELQAAKAELQKKRSILRGANERHDKLLESSSPDPQEVLEAKVGVAETELGVAKAKLGVAEAKEETPERQTEIAKAEMGVAKAEWDVAIAVYNSEAKTSNSEKLEILQGRINDRKETYNDSRETYKRLEGQLSSLYFRAPPGSTRTSRSYLVSSLLFIALPRNSVVCSRTCLIVAMNSQTCLTLLLQLMHCIYACTCIRQHT